MKRKVIQIGDSTQLISLPRAWSVSNGIKKGDELEVVTDADKMTVMAGEQSAVKTTTLNLADMKTLKRRSICAAYLRGYSGIEIQYSSPEYIQVIQQVLTEFPGYEIVRQGKTNCSIKQISAPRPGEFESVFNRLFLLLHDTALYISEALDKKDAAMLKSIPYREVNINKFANFCRRLINNRSTTSTENATVNYYILASLEQLGDAYKELAQYLAKNTDVPKEVNEALKDAAVLLDGVYRLHTKYRKELMIENGVHYSNLQVNIKKLANSGKTDAYLFHYITKINEIIIGMQEVMMQLWV